LIIFVFVGVILTIVVQSSSAAMTITITMAFNGWIDFPTACALVLGENIGTTITAFLASLNANYHAKRTARAHMIFNVFGVVWMLIFFHWFIQWVDYLAPGDSLSADNIPIHLSLFHTMFNILNVLFLIWIISIGVEASGIPDECKGLVGNELEICNSLYDLGSGLATGLVIFLWVAADVILGIVWLVTNRSGKRDCPSCGKSVKRGLTTCQNCNHDFASAASSGTSGS